MKLIVIVFALLTLACEKQASEAPPVNAASAGAAPTAPREPGTGPSAAPELRSGPPALVLDHLDPRDDAITVVIAKGAVFLDDEPEPVLALPDRETLAKNGIASPSGVDTHSSLLIAPLAERLRTKRSTAGAAPRSAVVVAHRQTPYRLLTEVLYTLGQSELGRYHLVVMKEEPPAPAAAVAVEALPVIAEAKPLAAVGDGAFNLVARLQGRGVTLVVRGKHVASGCEGLGSGVTVPRRGNALDLPTIAACAARLKKTRSTETTVTITADPDARFDELVAVIDALRVAKDGTMFSDFHFGVPR